MRATIEKQGTELARQFVRYLDAGPYYDLPDISEAHAAADAVAEIDTLFVAGNSLEAIRRYHELTKLTWDDVHGQMRNWVALTRAQKLALFGWRPKGTPQDDELDLQEHPMHDRVLDG